MDEAGYPGDRVRDAGQGPPAPVAKAESNGLLAFALDYAPYAGSAITFVLLTAVALVSFEGVTTALLVAVKAISVQMERTRGGVRSG
jgi:hypothetical protein